MVSDDIAFSYNLYREGKNTNLAYTEYEIKQSSIYRDSVQLNMNFHKNRLDVFEDQILSFLMKNVYLFIKFLQSTL